MHPIIQPSFNPGNNSITYTDAVNHTVWSLTAKITFFSPGTIGLANAYLLQDRPKGSVMPREYFEPSFDLRTASVGPNVFNLTSEVEGVYTRNEPDIINLALSQTTLPGTIIKGLVSNPPFESRIYTYNYTVWYGSASLNPAMTFKTPNMVVMDLNGQSFQSARYNLDANEITGVTN
jgi:hypothetical protein